MNKRQKVIDILTRIIISILSLSLLCAAIWLAATHPITIYFCGALFVLLFTGSIFRVIFGDQDTSIWCLLDKHDFGGWEYASPDNCTQIQICYRDGKINGSKKISHQWMAWGQDSSDPCQNIRACERCQQNEKVKKHSWGDWKYVKPGSCEQVMVCEGCLEEKHRIQHDWQSWEFKDMKGCVRVCNQCAIEENNAHAWEYSRTESWERDGPGYKYTERLFENIYVCVNCKVESVERNHRYFPDTH